jgi:hypothetical protein
MGALFFLLGYVSCAVTALVIDILHAQFRSRGKYRRLPPATTDQIRRAARANQLEVRMRELGPPASTNFDEEPTQ